ncbi:MAG: SpoIIE family protein phosphatase [Clostridia bacterium]|nr:SpoIIE family protein phosphatase [Clostridia bacterium]
MMKDVRKRKGILLNLKLNKQIAIRLGLLFLTARANIGGMIPFGLPAVCAWLFSEECTKWPLNRLLYILVFIFGSLSLGHWRAAGIVICGVLLFAFSASLLTGKEKNGKLGVLLILCTLVPGVVFLAGSSASFGDLLRFLAQLVITFIAFYLYCHVRSGLQARNRAAVLTQEQFAALCIGGVIVLLGLPDIIIAGISTMHIIAICLILLVAYTGGFGVGAACGTVAGILMASGNAVYMCMYALGGFLAGLLNRFKRLGAMIGFVIANILLACACGGTKELVLGMYETGFAAVLFLLIPGKPMGIFQIPMLQKIFAKAEFAPAEKSDGVAPLLGENYVPTGLMIGLTAGKVTELSRIGTEIAKQTEFLFEQNTQNETAAEEQSVVQLYSRVCVRCAMRESCYTTDYAKTYKVLQKLTYSVGRNDADALHQILGEMLSFCPNTEKLQGECKKITTQIRAEQVWRSRNQDCRRAAAQGLSKISRMLCRAGDELDEQRKVYYELRDLVRRGMETVEITLWDFSCRHTRSGHLEVSLAMPRSTLLPCNLHLEGRPLSCAEGCHHCTRAADILSKIVKKPMEASCLQRCEDNICTVLFVESPRYETEFGIVSAKAYQSPQSGDCFTKFQVEEGGVYAVLSDGLGTGQVASRQSNACMKLIRLFLEGGLNFGEASEAVDAFIAASGDGETVSTAVDALYLDLYSGIAHFAKRGAAPSYLLNPKESSCREITMAEAPLGFLGSSKTVREKMAHGCVIVLLSDGVSDAFSPEALPRFLISVFQEGADVQKSVKKILEKATALSSGKPKDDMTVAAVRIMEK